MSALAIAVRARDGDYVRAASRRRAHATRARCSTTPVSPARASSYSSRACGQRRAAHVGRARHADPRARRRARQDPRHGRARLRRAVDAGADRGAIDRRHRRRRASATWWASRPPPTCAACGSCTCRRPDGAGRQRHRRQGRRQPRARQEPDRRVPPAARWCWSIPTRWPRCRAASSAPGCTRSSSTASSPSDALLDLLDARLADVLTQRGDALGRGRRARAAASRPRSSRPTSARAACAASSTSGTPSDTPSRPPPATAACATARPWPRHARGARAGRGARRHAAPDLAARVTALLDRLGPLPSVADAAARRRASRPSAATRRS